MNSMTLQEVRLSARTDMPEGLSDWERQVYVSGYARGCLVFVKKHGAPIGAPDMSREELHQLTLAHEQARHPSCHRAGLAALRRYWKQYGRAA